MTEIVAPEELVTLALCGDVMTGRGIDQILAQPGDPRLYEQYITSALDYVSLAERVNGPIPRSAASSYIWGMALDEIREAQADAFIVNLETSVTQNTQAEPKGINYRMNPANISCLTAAGIDCCVLANNHVLDWGAIGLADTLCVLANNGLRSAGAGLTASDAAAPAIIDRGRKGRILVFAMGVADSGIALSWAAAPGKLGVNLLTDLSARSVDSISNQVRRAKQAGDVVVASIHWGGNWGYGIPSDHRQFARALIDEALIDVVHGHSSHHPKAAEIHRGKLILYGCGDFIDDYEGIEGYEQYRADLVVLYIAALERRSGSLRRLELVPFQVRNFRLNPPRADDTSWLLQRLGREFRRSGLDLELSSGGHIIVRWK